MSDTPRPPLLAFGLTDAAPAILRGVCCTPAAVADDCAERPMLLAFGLGDRVPSYRAPQPRVPLFVWGRAPSGDRPVS